MDIPQHSLNISNNFVYSDGFEKWHISICQYMPELTFVTAQSLCERMSGFFMP